MPVTLCAQLARPSAADSCSRHGRAPHSCSRLQQEAHCSQPYAAYAPTHPRPGSCSSCVHCAVTGCHAPCLPRLVVQGQAFPSPCPLCCEHSGRPNVACAGS
jgi:hypothetical protein